MRLHRFYIPEPIGMRTEVTIDDADLVHQIRNVFRLKNGAEIILFDGSGSDYTCRIEEGDKRSLTCAVVGASRSRYMPGRPVTLCAAVVKKDTFEWITEKATELGVAKIIPIIAERSEKKAVNEDRLKKISIEASEQSGRGNVPVLHQILSLEDAVRWVVENKLAAVAFHVDGPMFEPERFMKHSGGPLEVFIGPEGGWSPEEVVMFHENKIPVYSLGTQILRAETAVIAALSLTSLGK